MQLERTDYEYGTEISISNEGQPAYTVVCSDGGRGKNIPPSANIYLPKNRTLSVADVQRMARELDYVAQIAADLEAEKRAKYGEV